MVPGFGVVPGSGVVSGSVVVPPPAGVEPGFGVEVGRGAAVTGCGALLGRVEGEACGARLAGALAAPLRTPLRASDPARGADWFSDAGGAGAVPGGAGAASAAGAVVASGVGARKPDPPPEPAVSVLPKTMAAATTIAPPDSAAMCRALALDGSATGPTGAGGVLADTTSISPAKAADPSPAKIARSVETPSCSSVARMRAVRAAPRAIDDFGSASMAVGRSSCSESRCVTSGMREDPPMRRIDSSCAGSSPAASRASCSASIVCAMELSIIASNSPRVSRTLDRPAGTRTGITTSESNDSASLASMHSRRSWDSAMRVSGEPSCSTSAGTSAERSTCRSTASSKSAPPRLSRPTGSPTGWNDPSALRRMTQSKVPPPRSYTASVSPSSRAREAS